MIWWTRTQEFVDCPARHEPAAALELHRGQGALRDEVVRLRPRDAEEHGYLWHRVRETVLIEHLRALGGTSIIRVELIATFIADTIA